MRNRYSFFKFSIGKMKRKTMEDTQKDMDLKFTKGEILVGICFIFLLTAYFIPQEIISGIFALIAVLCYVVATVIDCFRYSPVTRWRHATIKSATYGLVWALLPIMLYLADLESREDMIPIALSSIFMWIAFVASLYMWIIKRKEAKARAAVLDMKIRTRRKNIC